LAHTECIGGDLVRIERLRLLHRLLHDLHRSVRVERVAFRLEAFDANFRDDRLGGRGGRMELLDEVGESMA
jgi:hypothetical protein